MSQESDDTYYQGTQFRIVKDDKGKASDIEWAEGETHQDRTENKDNPNPKPNPDPNRRKNCLLMYDDDPDIQWEIALEIRGM